MAAQLSPRKGIGWAIRQIRKAQDRTLEDLAEAAGTDAGNLSRVERGLQEVTERQLLAIATELGVAVFELWELAERGGSDASSSLLAKAAKLDPGARKQLDDFADYLLDRQSE